jgi:LysM repeat protein
MISQQRASTRRHALACRSLVLAAAVLVAGMPISAGEGNYTVRKGDTLSGIANTHGVALGRLAEQNRLSRSAPLHPGQRLIIPGSTSVKGSRSRDGLPAPVQRAIDKAAVTSGRWKHIVIHHSGVDTGTMAGMDRYHRETRHMENGLAYHFVIGNAHGLGDGEIGVGSRWTKQLPGGHLISEAQNQVSIGICLVGNFDNSEPTPKQLERLSALVRALMKRCRLPPAAVSTHQQINVVHTRCPGQKFPLRKLMSSLGG